MKIVTDIMNAQSAFLQLNEPKAVALGKFDGIHLGHRRLLEEILRQKRQGLASCVFTFDPSPAVFFGGADVRELTTREEKRVLFERMGIDILIEFPLSRESAGILPEDFVRDILAERMHTAFLAAGEDVSFGAGGSGDARLLRQLSDRYGFEVRIIDKVCLEGQAISSTYVRSQVEAGNLLLAGRLLGMSYPVMGKVVHGRRLGRKLGVPTVNIRPGKTKLMPPCGVYYSTARIRGRDYRAISNVGYRPTVADERILGLETYLYDFGEEIYGEDIEVYLHEFRRPEHKFTDTEALKAALFEDIRMGAVWEKPL